MRLVSTLSLGGIAIAAFSCADPRSAFDDFSDRIIDAGAQSQADAAPVATIPDVTGTFYLSYSPSVAPEALFRFITTATLHQGEDGATIDLSHQPLDRETLQPVGDPLVSTGVEISNSAEFEATTTGVIPAETNAVSGSRLMATITLSGHIRSEDLFCGPGGGQVTSPIALSLDGSTFGALRIEPDTLGDDLPEPVFDCPPDTPPADAGVPDAAIPDAGVSDASAPDAAAADANLSDASDG